MGVFEILSDTKGVPFWWTALKESATLAILGITAFLSIRTFRISTRVRAGDMLIKLEEEFRKHLLTAIRIDAKQQYASRYDSILRKAVDDTLELESQECETLAEIDGYLRHLLTCWHIKSLHAQNNRIDEAYRYYISILRHSQNPALYWYVYRYWRTLIEWIEFVTGEKHSEIVKKLTQHRTEALAAPPPSPSDPNTAPPASAGD